ncbi:MAG: discoidin domain-containing protein [Myxococcales bacterium]|nr:MAG: discoidin domain-containing protein [Myxococcales bacterium]
MQARLFWAGTPGAGLDRRSLLRLGGVAAVLALLVGVGVAVEGRYNRRRDLTEGRSWEASSSWGGTPRQGQFSRVMTRPFFHTDDESDPWIEIDLGAARPVTRIEIDNRSDYGKDRAVPLTISVAVARNAWREVARRDEVFDTWKASLPPNTQARWLRLQVKRRSLLHLDDVRVY